MRPIIEGIPTPKMHPYEIVCLEQHLLEIGRALRRPLQALEWGAGGSTVYFPALLDGHGISYRWVSVEYNREWYDRVQRGIAGLRVDLYLFDVGNERLTQRALPMDEYVAFPSTLGVSFDFILVDGRKRRRCLWEAARMIMPSGQVFLHDAHRGYYQCAFAAFSRGVFLTRSLWSGAGGVT